MTQPATFHDEEFVGRLDLRAWRKVLRHALAYKGSLAGLAGCSMALATMDSVFPLVTGFMVDAARANSPRALTRWGAAYFVMVFLFACTVRTFIGLAGRISTHVSHDIRRTLFAHLQDLSFSFFDRRAAGWLMARLTSDCDRVSRVIAWSTLDLVWSPCILAGLCAVIMFYHWRLGLIILSCIPGVVMLSLAFQRRILHSSRRMRKANSELTAAYSESLMAVRTTKTLAREGEALAEFQAKSGVMYEASLRNALQGALYMPMVFGIGSVATALALWLAGVDRLAGGITIGTLVMLMSCAGQISFPVQEMAKALTDVQGAQAAAERIVSVLETQPDVRDSAEVSAAMDRHAADMHKGQAAPDGRPAGIAQIEFRDVSFAYGDGPPVLKGFNLVVRAGESIAMVGPTGGGKTTIISLLCRFYEPTAGEILVDGVDYRRRSLAWWQSKLGVVLQTPHLFSGTARENIRYGRLEASDAEVTQAARQVGAHDFIAGLEKGYDSEVGQAGNRLSVGQKQLVSFARAVLADPAILIMDEATSSIDAQTESVIQAGMKRMLAGRTSFIIAHRLSTNRGADRILVIDGGRIVEQGTHRELLVAGGRYHRLYTRQFQREKEDRVMAEEKAPEPL
jgi:ATP-binding cassette, subfamily B, bacterial